MPQQTELPLTWDRLDREIEALAISRRARRTLHGIYSLAPRGADGKVLGSHKHKDGIVIEATRTKIAKAARSSLASVRRGLDEAAAVGLVEIIHRAGDCSAYRLDCSAIIDGVRAVETTAAERWEASRRRGPIPGVGSGVGPEPAHEPTPEPTPEPTRKWSAHPAHPAASPLLKPEEELNTSQPAPARTRTSALSDFHAHLRRLPFDVPDGVLTSPAAAVELCRLAVEHGVIDEAEVRALCGALAWASRQPRNRDGIANPQGFFGWCLLGPRDRWMDREEPRDRDTAERLFAAFESQAAVSAGRN